MWIKNIFRNFRDDYKRKITPENDSVYLLNHKLLTMLSIAKILFIVVQPNSLEKTHNQAVKLNNIFK